MWHETFPIRAFLQIYLVPNRKFLPYRPKYRSVQENRRRNVEARFVLPSSDSAEHGRNLPSTSAGHRERGKSPYRTVKIKISIEFYVTVSVVLLSPAAQ